MAEREEWGAGGGGGRRVGGLEVGRAISEPSVAQWLTGGYTTYYRRPATTASASAVSGPAIVSTYNLIGICLTQLAKYRLVLPLIRISNGRFHSIPPLVSYRRFVNRRFAAVPT